MPRTTVWILYLLLAVCCCCRCCSAEEDNRELFVPREDGGTDSLHVYVAAFGNRLQSSSSFRLMLPPQENGLSLCEFPNATANEKWAHTYDQTISTALYVAHDETRCTAEQQARVAAKLQETILPTLRYLVVYGIDPKAAVTPITLTASDPSGLGRIGVVYMPWFDAQVMTSHLQQRAKQSNKSSRLFDPLSFDWQFDVWMQGRVRHNTETKNHGPLYSNSFYWLRFALFTLLIVAPIFRAVYLWYLGGGRLHWRRNQQGRINGILYIPPIPFWLTAGRFANSQPAVTVKETLTQEEFDKLPEIVFVPPSSTVGDDDKNDDAAPDTTGAAGTVEPDYSAMDLEQSATFDEDSSGGRDELDSGNNTIVPQGNNNNDEEDTAHADDHPAENDSPDTTTPLTTTCTMCSICIEDFEEGERLLLLPRCHHAFHKDCLHPWLLERQGSCPLCKTSVLLVEPETDDSFLSEEEDDEEAQIVNNGDNNVREQGPLEATR